MGSNCANLDAELHGVSKPEELTADDLIAETFEVVVEEAGLKSAEEPIVVD